MDSSVSLGNCNLGFCSPERDLEYFSKVFLALVLVFTMSFSASAELRVNNSLEDVYAANDTLEVLLEAENKSNYTMNVFSDSMGLLENKDMVFEESLSNQSESFVYSANYKVNNPSGGRRIEADTDSSNISKTLNQTLEFFVVDGQPVILESRVGPPVKYNGGVLNAEIRVADSKKDVEQAEIDIGEEVFSLNQTDSENYVQVFYTDFSVEEIGGYSYSMETLDADGSGDSAQGEFYVRGSPDSEDTNVSVSVDNQCLNMTTTLSAPGNEPNNVITRNTTGSFLGEFFNSGNLPHEMDVDLDVTFEGNDTWRKGEDKGPVVTSFQPKNFTLEGNNRGEYFRQFAAIYEPGNYTGRMNVDSICNDDLDNRTLENNFTVTDNFQIVDVEGEDSLIENGSQTTNQSIPADASREGSESDQFLEGNNDEPGTTLEPDPEPEPSLSINMETLNPTYSSSKNSFERVGLTVENYANALNQVQIMPRVQDLEGDWSIRSNTLSTVTPTSDINTSVYLQPSESVPIGEYRIPVVASLPSGRSLDVEYINLEVTEEVVFSNLSIVEAPRKINIERNSSTKVPVLLQNTGGEELTNVTVELQGMRECGQFEPPENKKISSGDSKSIESDFISGTKTSNCEGLLVASSDQGTYAFSNIKIDVQPKEGFIPKEFRVPLIASLWTVLLLVYALVSRRFDLDRITVKLPYLILILGETIIILYLATTYYGLVPPELLPF